MEYNFRRICAKFKKNVDVIEFILKNFDYSEYSKDQDFKDLFSITVLDILKKYIYKEANYFSDSEEVLLYTIEDIYTQLDKYKGQPFDRWILKSFKNDIKDFKDSKKSKSKYKYYLDDPDCFIVPSDEDEYEFDNEESFYEAIMKNYHVFVNSLKNYKKFTKKQRREILSCNGRNGNTYKAVAKKYGFTEAQIKNERKHLVDELIKFYIDKGFEVERK